MFCRYKVAVNKLGGYDHTYERSFMKFSITSPPFSLDEIDSVVLKVYCTAVSAAADVVLKSSKTDATGWGTTLQATSGDWQSTATNTEETKSISSTGYKEYSVDKNNLNLNGNTYFRLGIPSVQSLVQWATQNHGTSSYRPVLIITYTTAAGVTYTHLIPCMGAGN